MRHLRSFTFAALLALIALLPAATALATTKCICKNGEIVQSMDDDDDACSDACEMLGGGGRPWTPGDDGGDVTVDDRREPARDRVENPAERR